MSGISRRRFWSLKGLIQLFFCLAFSFFVSGLLLANSANYFEGAGSSGGGVEFGDSKNPWWLENTRQVKYCIVHNKATFSAPIELAREQIDKAIDHWRHELAKVNPIVQDALLSPRPVVIGTQEFVEVKCHEKPLLRFQFGTLSDDQKESLRDYPSIIGVAFREAYDRVDLRASGYIYLAPDIGPQKPRILANKETVWNTHEGEILFHILVHEFGHIFGFPHSRSIMSETYVAGIVSEDEPFLSQRIKYGIPDFIRLVDRPAGFSYCLPNEHLDGEDKVFKSYFDGKSQSDPRDFSCIGVPEGEDRRYSYDARIRDGQIEIVTGPDCRQMNYVVARTNAVKILEESGSPMVWVVLNPQQKVFELKPSKADTRTLGLVPRLTRDYKGSFEVLTTGKSYPISFTLSADSSWPPRISALVDGKLYMDLLRNY